MRLAIVDSDVLSESIFNLFCSIHNIIFFKKWETFYQDSIMNWFDSVFIALEELADDSYDLIRKQANRFQVPVVFLSENLKFTKPFLPMYQFSLLKKPLTERQVRIALNELQAIQNTLRIQIIINRSIQSFSVKDILYFETQGHHVRMKLRTDEVVFYGNLRSIEKKYQNYFIRVHESYLVNRSAISHFAKNFIRLCTGEKIPVSRVGGQRLI